MKVLATLVLSSSAFVFATPAAAQFQKPEDAIKYRQGAMFVKGQHLGRIGAMVNGRVPFNAKLAAENADVVAMMAGLVLPGYGPGTEGGKAKPEIWKDQTKFKELADAGLAEAVKLAAAAKTGDLDNVKAAFGAAAETCKSCHDAFRSK
ncbi:MAG: cytochrome c [Burkholderiaceae bacterium]|nr:cytochrome c [Burkholderiaceae bacterium]